MNPLPLSVSSARGLECVPTMPWNECPPSRGMSAHLHWNTHWKDRKAILPAIKAIYRAETAEVARQRLEEFEAEWGKRYPAIGQAWRRNWEHVVPIFAFAPGIRKMIYTKNAVEALNRSLRKIIKTRGSFLNDGEAVKQLIQWIDCRTNALKLLYLAIRNAGMHWRKGIDWTNAMGQFAIHFGDRFPGSAR